jgi:uncharacterized damage-inducible protein DinB
VHFVPILRIDPIPGYSPTIGRLVCMLTYVRQTLIASANGLGQRELDHLHDTASNSIGALLAHAVAVERSYQLLTFERRAPSPEEAANWSAALDLGEAGRRSLRGHGLEWYLDEMAETRTATLRALAERDDAWLEQPLERAPNMNAHWAWFHVAEDEINHRGQIRWLRPRLPPAAGGAARQSSDEGRDA